MEIKASIVADSISQTGSRLTTFELDFPRFILSEFLTHRAFSRNSASSRAIPVEKTLELAKTDPATFVKWPAEQQGMQGGVELEGDALKDAQQLFDTIRDNTIGLIEDYVNSREKDQRIHKSCLNRPMEWFQMHRVVVTSTEYENFFKQRSHKDAQPEIEVLSRAMEPLYRKSEPTELHKGEWHLPYVSPGEKTAFTGSETRIMSVARCARASYNNFGKKMGLDNDKGLYSFLLGGEVIHYSPFEHVATPTEGLFYNFSDWKQLRYFIATGEPVL